MAQKLISKMSKLSPHMQALQSQYPWISFPLITSAPMRIIATAPLALAVSRAKGIGFLGGGTESSTIAKLINDTIISDQASPIPNVPAGVLPVGIGFICWGGGLKEAMSVISKAPLKPAAAWLFAPKETSDLVSWSEGIRGASGGKTKMWIQVGTVANALEVARSCRPDVLVIQGADAGGHGLAQSSSIISLLPECVDTLEREGFGDIPLIAAGGIVDSRGVAASIVLGASGVNMGTRFLATPEAVISQGYRDAVLKASDGGVSTARTTVYDRIRGTVGWPDHYDGRGVVNQSFWDDSKGMSESENKILYSESVKKGDAGWGEQGRMTTYAGTGVGLIRKVVPAGEIVDEVRYGAKAIISRASKT